MFERSPEGNLVSLWRAIESRRNRNMDSLGSSVTAVIRWPISWANLMASYIIINIIIINREKIILMLEQL